MAVVTRRPLAARRRSTLPSIALIASSHTDAADRWTARDASTPVEIDDSRSRSTTWVTQPLHLLGVVRDQYDGAPADQPGHRGFHHVPRRAVQVGKDCTGESTIPAGSPVASANTVLAQPHTSRCRVHDAHNSYLKDPGCSGRSSPSTVTGPVTHTRT